MSSYVNKRSRVFRHSSPRLPRQRSESRLKTYPSATDNRSWTDCTEQRRQYILELINSRSKSLSLGRYIPLEVIIDQLLASKNAQIAELQNELNECKKHLSSLSGKDANYAETADVKLDPDSPLKKEFIKVSDGSPLTAGEIEDQDSGPIKDKYQTERKISKAADKRASSVAPDSSEPYDPARSDKVPAGEASDASGTEPDSSSRQEPIFYDAESEGYDKQGAPSESIRGSKRGVDAKRYRGSKEETSDVTDDDAVPGRTSRSGRKSGAQRYPGSEDNTRDVSDDDAAQGRSSRSERGSDAHRYPGSAGKTRDVADDGTIRSEKGADSQRYPGFEDETRDGADQEGALDGTRRSTAQRSNRMSYNANNQVDVGSGRDASKHVGTGFEESEEADEDVLKLLTDSGSSFRKSKPGAASPSRGSHVGSVSFREDFETLDHKGAYDRISVTSKTCSVPSCPVSLVLKESASIKERASHGTTEAGVPLGDNADQAGSNLQDTASLRYPTDQDKTFASQTSASITSKRSCKNPSCPSSIRDSVSINYPASHEASLAIAPDKDFLIPKKIPTQQSTARNSFAPSLSHTPCKTPSCPISSILSESASLRRAPDQESNRVFSPDQRTSIAQPTNQRTSIAQPTSQRTSIAQPTSQRTSIAQPTSQRTSIAQPCSQRTSIAQPCSQRTSTAISPDERASTALPSSQRTSVAQPAGERISPAISYSQRASTAQTPIQRRSTALSPSQRTSTTQSASERISPAISPSQKTNTAQSSQRASILQPTIQGSCSAAGTAPCSAPASAAIEPKSSTAASPSQRSCKTTPCLPSFAEKPSGSVKSATSNKFGESVVESELLDSSLKYVYGRLVEENDFIVKEKASSKDKEQDLISSMSDELVRTKSSCSKFLELARQAIEKLETISGIVHGDILWAGDADYKCSCRQNGTSKDLCELENKCTKLEDTIKERDALKYRVAQLETELFKYQDLPARVEKFNENAKLALEDVETCCNLQERFTNVGGLEDDVAALLSKLRRKKSKKENAQTQSLLSECESCAKYEIQVKDLKRDLDNSKSRQQEMDLMKIEHERLQLRIDQLDVLEKNQGNLLSKLKLLEDAQYERNLYKEKYEKLMHLERESECLRKQLEKLRSIEREKNALQRHVCDLECCIVDLEDEIKRLVGHIDRLTQGKDVQQAQIKDAMSDMRAEIEIKNLIIAKSEENIAIVQDKLEESIIGVSNETTSLKNKLEECEKVVIDKDCELAFLNKTISEKDQLICSLSRGKQIAQQLVEEKDEEIKEFCRKINDLISKNERLQKNIEKLDIFNKEPIKQVILDSKNVMGRIKSEVDKYYTEWETNASNPQYIRDLEDKINILESELKAIKGIYFDMKDNSKEKNMTEESLQNENATLRKHSVELQIAAKCQVEGIMDHLLKVQRKLVDMENSDADCKRCSCYQEQIENLIVENDVLLQENQRFQRSLGESLCNFNELVEEKSKMEQERCHYLKDIKELNGEISTLRSDRNKMEKEIENLKTKLQNIDEALNKERHLYDTEKLQILNKFDEQKELLENVSQKYEKIKMEESKLLSEIKMHEEREQFAQLENENLKNEINKLKIQLEDITKELNEKKESFESTVTGSKILKSEYDDLTNLLKTKNEEYLVLKNQNNDLTDSFRKIGEENLHLKNENNKMDSTIKSIESQNQNLLDEQQNLKQEYNIIQDRFKKCQVELTNLKKDLDESSNKNSDNKNKDDYKLLYEDMKNEIQNCLTKNATLTEEIVVLKSNINKLQQTISESKKSDSFCSVKTSIHEKTDITETEISIDDFEDVEETFEDEIVKDEFIKDSDEKEENNASNNFQSSKENLNSLVDKATVYQTKTTDFEDKKDLISETMNEIEENKNDIISILSAIDDQLSKNPINKLETKEVHTMTDSVKDLVNQDKAHNDMLMKMKEQYEREINDLKMSQTTNRDRNDLEQQLINQKKEYEIMIQKLQDSYEKEIKELKSVQSINKNQNDLDEALEEQRKEFEMMLKNLQESHEQEIKELKSRQSINKNQNNLEEALEQQKKECELMLKNLRDSYEQEIKELKSVQSINKNQNNLDEALEEQKKEFERMLKNLQETHEQEIKVLKSVQSLNKNQSDLDEQRKENEVIIKNIEKDSSKEEWNSIKINQPNTNQNYLENALDNQRKEYEAKITKLKESYEQEIAKFKHLQALNNTSLDKDLENTKKGQPTSNNESVLKVDEENALAEANKKIAELEKELEDIKKKSYEKIKLFEKQYRDEIKAFQTLNNQNLDTQEPDNFSNDSRQPHNQFLSTKNKGVQTDPDVMRKESNSIMIKLKEQYEREINNLRRRHEQNIEKLQRAHEDEIGMLEKEQALVTETLKDELKKFEISIRSSEKELKILREVAQKLEKSTDEEEPVKDTGPVAINNEQKSNKVNDPDGKSSPRQNPRTPTLTLRTFENVCICSKFPQVIPIVPSIIPEENPLADGNDVTSILRKSLENGMQSLSFEELKYLHSTLRLVAEKKNPKFTKTQVKKSNQIGSKDTSSNDKSVEVEPNKVPSLQTVIKNEEERIAHLSNILQKEKEQNVQLKAKLSELESKNKLKKRRTDVSRRDRFDVN